MLNFAVANQRVHDGLNNLRGNSEAHAAERARGRDQEGVDADDLATSVDERASGVALVDGRVGLNVLAGLARVIVIRIRTIERADDAARHGEAETERVAEGENGLAGAKLGRIAEGNVREIGAFDLDHREIGERIGANHLRLEDAPVAERDLDVGGAFDDVVVGDDVAIGRDDHSAADAVLKLRLLRHHLAPATVAAESKLTLEELLHVVRGTLLRALLLHHLLLVNLGGDGNVHDGGSYAGSDGFHCLVERQQGFHFAVVERGGVGAGRARAGGLNEMIGAEASDHGNGQDGDSDAALGRLGVRAVHGLFRLLYCLLLLVDPLSNFYTKN